MNTARKLLLFGDQSWGSYIRKLSPTMWFQMRATSGTTEANAGTGGSAYNGTITGATLGQTGIVPPPPNAYLYDGSGDYIDSTGSTALSFAGDMSVIALVTCASASGARRVMGKGGVYQLSFTTGTNTLSWLRARATTNQSYITSTTYATSSWLLIVVNSTLSGAEIWVNGVQASYGTATVGSGAQSTDANSWRVGASATGTVGFNGTMDEFALIPNTLSQAQIIQLTQLAGLA